MRLIPEVIAGRCTHATQTKKKNQVVNLRVKYRPQSPRSPRFHSFHFCALRSAASFRCVALRMPSISSFFHSAPMTGTVTISTGAASDWLSSLEGLGEFTRRYLQQGNSQQIVFSA